MLDVVLSSLLLAVLFMLLRNAPSWLIKQPLRRGQLSTYRLAPRKHWMVERDGITVSATTTALNPLPKKLISRLEALGQSAREKTKRFYDTGVVFGILGMTIGLGGAVWAWARAWIAVWNEAEAHARTQSTTVAHVMKRALADAAIAVPQVHEGGGGLQPLIPGVTAPFSHLPTLVLAFLLSQLLHELGHAIAAGLEDMAPSKLAFSIHLILPSASVVFPSNVDYLPVRARSRIATSGPWHNLLLWVVLIFLGPFGRGLFYVNRANDGRIVADVKSYSTLAEHFRPGDLITHIDDTPVTGREDIWTRYLTSEETEDLSNGWCISKWEFSDAPLTPCRDEHLIGFNRISALKEAPRCLEPHTIVAQPITPCKCAVSQVCIRPAASEHILRIRYKRGEKRDTVLWAGERSAVFQQVQVTTHSSRFWGAGTRWVELVLTYLKMATLSLYLVNLLPLPHTDGIQLFSALLSSRRTRSGGGRQLSTSRSQHPTINPYRYDGYDSDDSDAGGPEPSWAAGYGRREEIWQRRLRRIVEGGTAALVAGWALGWMMLALLRSS